MTDRLRRIRIGVMVTSCVGLLCFFADQFVLIAAAFTGLVISEFSEAKHWRPLGFVVVGSVIACLCMELAFWLRQFAFLPQIPQLQFLMFAHLILCMAACLPALILLRVYSIGDRRLTVIMAVSLGAGGFAYHLWGTHDSPRFLWAVYSRISYACCFGAMSTTFLVCLRENLLSAHEEMC